jgi:hypothetical protein
MTALTRRGPIQLWHAAIDIVIGPIAELDLMGAGIGDLALPTRATGPRSRPRVSM